jgi:hypothetical protein
MSDKELTQEEKKFILDIFKNMQVQVSSPDAQAIVELVQSISSKLAEEPVAEEEALAA